MDIQEVLIVSIGSFCLFVAMPAIISIASYQEKKLKLQRDIAMSGGAETRAELESLRQRVAVLERLLTDDDRRLAGEIEQLRRDQGDGVRA
jgi:cell division protein FtsB